MAVETVELLRIGGVVVGPGIYAAFAKLEEIASPDCKRTVSAWLRRTESPGALTNLPRQFVALFDQVFGEKHLSLRCFFRSCVASVASIVVLTLMWASMRPEQALEFFATAKMDTVTRNLFVMLLVNLIPDYLSLLESRCVLSIMSRTRSSIRVAILAALDSIFSILIFAASLYVCMLAVSYLVSFRFDTPPWETLGISFYKYSFEVFKGAIGEMVNYGLFLNVSEPLETPMVSSGVLVYTSLFTSVWSWLYALSAWAIRLLLPIQQAIGSMKHIFDIDEKPLRAIGYVGGFIVTVLWWALVLIVGPTG